MQRMSHPSQQTAPGGREVAEVVVSEFLSVSPCVEELCQFMLSLLCTWIINTVFCYADAIQF